MKKDNIGGEKKQKIDKKNYWGLLNFNPSAPLGEDSVSSNLHIETLCKQYRKSTKDMKIVHELSKLTFYIRRDMLLKSEAVSDVIKKFPFLKECDMVCYH